MNWDLVCKPKKLVGLRIIDVKTFNEALLAKWYWQWINPERKLKSIFMAEPIHDTTGVAGFYILSRNDHAGHAIYGLLHTKDTR